MQKGFDKIKVKITGLKIKFLELKTKLMIIIFLGICYDEIENTAVTKCCNTKFCVECT